MDEIPFLKIPQIYEIGMTFILLFSFVLMCGMVLRKSVAQLL